MKKTRLYLKHFSLQLGVLAALIIAPYFITIKVLPTVPNVPVYFVIITMFLRLFIMTNTRYSYKNMKKFLQSSGVKSPSNKDITEHVRLFSFLNNFNFILIFLTIVTTAIIFHKL